MPAALSFQFQRRILFVNRPGNGRRRPPSTKARPRSGSVAIWSDRRDGCGPARVRRNRNLRRRLSLCRISQGAGSGYSAPTGDLTCDSSERPVKRRRLHDGPRVGSRHRAEGRLTHSHTFACNDTHISICSSPVLGLFHAPVGGWRSRLPADRSEAIDEAARAGSGILGRQSDDRVRAFSDGLVPGVSV